MPRASSSARRRQSKASNFAPAAVGAMVVAEGLAAKAGLPGRTEAVLAILMRLRETADADDARVTKEVVAAEISYQLEKSRCREPDALRELAAIAQSPAESACLEAAAPSICNAFDDFEVAAAGDEAASKYGAPVVGARQAAGALTRASCAARAHVFIRSLLGMAIFLSVCFVADVSKVEAALDGVFQSFTDKCALRSVAADAWAFRNDPSLDALWREVKAVPLQEEAQLPLQAALLLLVLEVTVNVLASTSLVLCGVASLFKAGSRDRRAGCCRTLCWSFCRALSCFCLDDAANILLCCAHGRGNAEICSGVELRD
ncbi:hypothetical protein FNF27_04236 [Cafeteria roenbergensis]|uniref:Uncharacterized protein n=2 Tax=Cafeteria roenbergensis TaxID=33653 RepID=A0A5A8EAI5_CAFRO|nr:hypothetical protein FNF27_04236 [Cafeteria roenbergensis]